MCRRLTLSAFIVFVLLIAFGILLSAGGNCSHLLDYLSQQAMRSVTYAFLAMAAGTLISAGQVDVSPAASLNLFGMVVIYISNVSGGGYSIGAIAPIILLITLLLYGGYALALDRLSLLSALILTLSATFVLRGSGEFLQLGMQKAGPLAPLLNSEGLPDLINSPLTKERLDSFLLNPLHHAIGFAGALIALHFWRYHTRMGLHHLALGESGLAAVRAGVNRGRVLWFAFLIAGVFVFLGWANEFFAVRRTSWSLHSANGLELLAIAAAVIGGARIEGGRFDPISVALAGILLNLAQSIVPLINIASEMMYIVIGAVLVIVAIFDGIKEFKGEQQNRMLCVRKPQ